MKSLFRCHVLSEIAARRLALGSGFALLAAVIALVVLAAPDLQIATRALLVSGVCVASAVLGSQVRSAIRI